MKLIRYEYPQKTTAIGFNRFFDLARPSYGRAGSQLGDFLQSTSPFGQPAADLYEDDDSYFVRFELPGLTKDDLSLELENGSLTVGSLSSEDSKDKKVGWSFQRSLSVPDSVDASAVSASLLDGVLTVKLPKAEATKPRQITVE